MTARAAIWREAVTLPWLFLAVALSASVRVTVDGQLRIVPPPLSALVLTLLLLALLVRAGQLDPSRLMHAGRSALENLGGAVVVMSLGWATAAVIALVTPESGLPKLAGLVLLAGLLANTLAAAPTRRAALRALFVACLVAFTFKFVVLHALAAPPDSVGGRLLAGLLDGVTLGTLHYMRWAPITGYLAFGTVIAYFGALGLLPRPSPGTGLATVAPGSIQ